MTTGALKQFNHTIWKDRRLPTRLAKAISENLHSKKAKVEILVVHGYEDDLHTVQYREQIARISVANQHFDSSTDICQTVRSQHIIGSLVRLSRCLKRTSWSCTSFEDDFSKLGFCFTSTRTKSMINVNLHWTWISRGELP